MAQAGGPERRFFRRLQDHRRLERPCDDPFDLPGASKLWPTQWISSTNFAIPRIAPFWPWIRAKYALTPQLDVTGAFYYLDQTNYTQHHAYDLRRHPLHNCRTQTVIKSPLDASTAATAPARTTSFGPHRLSAGQARRPLRWLDGLQCLRRSRERLSGDPGHLADRRRAHQILTISHLARTRRCPPRRVHDKRRRWRRRGPTRPSSELRLEPPVSSTPRAGPLSPGGEPPEIRFPRIQAGAQTDRLITIARRPAPARFMPPTDALGGSPAGYRSAGARVSGSGPSCRGGG